MMRRMHDPLPSEQSVGDPVVCVVCGTRLGGLAPEDACPGCGQPVSNSTQRAQRLARPPAGQPSVATVPDALLCITCRTPIGGRAITEHCTACGTHVGCSMPDERLAEIPADRVPCRVCSYDLTGLTFADVCPECGTPVPSSHLDASLATAPREQVVKVARGLAMVFWLVILSIFIGPLTLAFSGFGATAGASPALLIISTAFSAAGFYAWFLATTPITRMPNERGNRLLRAWLLSLLGVGVLFGVLNAVVVTMTAGRPPGSAGLLMLLTLPASILGGLSSVALFFIQLVYLRRVAAFMPSRTLEKRFTNLIRVAIWGTLGAVVFFFVAAIVGAALAFGGGGAGLALLVIPYAVIGIGALAWYVYYLGGILRLSRGAKRATKSLDVRAA